MRTAVMTPRTLSNPRRGQSGLRPAKAERLDNVRALHRWREIARELTTYFAEVDANRQPVSAEEAESIITDALRTSRPAYRPHQ